MKTNKSLTKRLKITSTGKILARRPGKNHFNAKESRSKQLAGKRAAVVVMKNKDIGRYLPNLVK
jgi:ribosomal protein L35